MSFVGWVGFKKSYVIFRVGHGKCLGMSDYKVGGWGKKGQKYAYVIFERSLNHQRGWWVGLKKSKT